MLLSLKYSVLLTFNFTVGTTVNVTSNKLSLDNFIPLNTHVNTYFCLSPLQYDVLIVGPLPNYFFVRLLFRFSNVISVRLVLLCALQLT